MNLEIKFLTTYLRNLVLLHLDQYGEKWRGTKSLTQVWLPSNVEEFWRKVEVGLKYFN